MAPKQKKTDAESPAAAAAEKPAKGAKSAITKSPAPPRPRKTAPESETKIVRHRAAPSGEDDYGVEDPSIHRMARLGGVLRLSKQVVGRMKRIMDARMLHLLRSSAVFMGQRKTLQPEDVRSALIERDTAIY